MNGLLGSNPQPSMRACPDGGNNWQLHRLKSFAGSPPSSSRWKQRLAIGDVAPIGLKPMESGTAGQLGNRQLSSRWDKPNGNVCTAHYPAGVEVSLPEPGEPPLGCIGLFVEFGRQIGRPDSACRRRASSSINRKSPPNLSAISRRVRCISSMIVSVICFWIIIHHFFRSADDWDRNPKVVKKLVYSRSEKRITSARLVYHEL